MATKTIQIADKPTLDEIKAVLENSEYGLEVLKSMVETETDKQLMSVTLLNSVHNQSWTEMYTLQYPIMEFPIVIYNGEIHTFSSFNNESATYTHYKWDGTEWTSASTLPCGFGCGSAVVYNNEVHIMGGAYNATAHYKWDGSSWSEVSTLPYGFYRGAAVVYNDEIHILGSQDGDRTQHYKWNGSSWSEVSTLPYGFYYGSSVIYNGEIHVLGGDYTYTKHYKWDGSSWSEVSTLPYWFCYGSAVVYNNEVHIFGGYNTHYAHYKWNGTEWNSVTTLPYYFNKGSAVVYNDEIHILGGSSKYHYKLLDLKVMPSIYLPKDAKIYSSDTLSDISNCKKESDHLVVTDTGIVSFGAKSTKDSFIITIIN